MSRGMRNSPVADLLGDEATTVECTHCGVEMTSHLGSSGQVRYFRCGSCHRWVSTMYRDVLGADAKVRAVRPQPIGAKEDFARVKDRLERWLASLEQQDPYRALGVSPADSTDTIRVRYHQLALEKHPDRGGSPDAMREINDAYERIVHHRDRRRTEALPVRSEVSLPASSR
jgi:hypothetical protein